MIKSQFNIKISKDLLTRIKRQATMSGKSLTEHITDLVTRSLEDDSFENDDLNIGNKYKDFEKRLISIESTLSNLQYLSDKLHPFTNSEAKNCTNFMRGVFKNEVVKRQIEDKNKAFEDFLSHVDINVESPNLYADRLKEIMLSDNPVPWTAKELNSLASNSKCKCPIRSALIYWTGKIDCPSQQEICDKGEKLLPL